MSQPNFFDILGVPRTFALAPDEIERRFHARSRELHPDRHVKADPQTRVKNALAATELNEALRTLRDPIKRAEHLLKLEGIDLSEDGKGFTVESGFLMEIMELREALADARESDDAARVRALGGDVRARRDEMLAKIGALFAEFESGARGRLKSIADTLVAERYFRRFLDEVEAFEDALAERVLQ